MSTYTDEHTDEQLLIMFEEDWRIFLESQPPHEDDSAKKRENWHSWLDMMNDYEMISDDQNFRIRYLDQ